MPRFSLPDPLVGDEAQQRNNEVLLSAVNRLAVDTPTGGTGLSYSQTISSASTTWTLNHNIGYKPAITTFDNTGEQIFGVVTYPTINTAVVTFSAAVSGTALAS